MELRCCGRGQYRETCALCCGYRVRKRGQHADLHRFAFLLGETDGQELFGEQAR